MSWPQHPEDPRGRSPQGPPPYTPPPQQGFGPPPAWPPTGAQPPLQQPGPRQGYGYGHPQQPPYGHPHPPYGQQPPVPAPPPPPRKRRTGLVVTGAVVVVAVVAVGVTLVERGGHHRHAVAGPSASPSSAPRPSEAAPGLSGSTPGPLVPGWQTQAEAEHGFAYDVPPTAQEWKLNSVGQDLAYTDENNNPVVVMSGTAVYHEGGCGTAGRHTGPVQAGRGQLATVGEQGSTKGTLQVNARNVAGNWLWAAYGGAGGHKPGSIRVTDAVPWNHNGIKGYMAKGTATGIFRPSACVPATAVSYGIAMRLPDGSVGLWVLYADQGVPGALTAGQIEKIMDTVRPYNGS